MKKPKTKPYFVEWSQYERVDYRNEVDAVSAEDALAQVRKDPNAGNCVCFGAGGEILPDRRFAFNAYPQEEAEDEDIDNA
jgi:hypothetical protein